jgi:hypothetical protein
MCGILINLKYCSLCIHEERFLEEREREREEERVVQRERMVNTEIKQIKWTEA